MDSPSPPPPPAPDPLLIQQQQQAQVDSIDALQTRLQGDTSSIMSRYGALFSMQNITGGSGGGVATGSSGKPSIADVQNGFSGILPAPLVGAFGAQLGLK